MLRFFRQKFCEHSWTWSERRKEQLCHKCGKQLVRSVSISSELLVVGFSETRIYVNAGADRNVQPGTSLTVWRRGRELTDPHSGDVLDVEMTHVGRIRIETVRERLSIADVIDGEQPMRGDVLVVESL